MWVTLNFTHKYMANEIWVNSKIYEIMGNGNMGKFLEIDKYG